MLASFLSKIYINIPQGNIVVMADRFLILSLFFHRSILNQYGLWNSQKSTSNSMYQLSSFMELTYIFENSEFQQETLARDVYTPMLFCDFFNIIIVIICYNQLNVMVHIWLWDLSNITDRKFGNNFAIKLWYLFKCIHFGYSSIQIRSGYPTHIAGNFLMKHFNFINE
ncbi:unnamed protein product [Rotaria sp. Silwood1]|nr:unnamed protein product [Rotaria sp. Silwood1]